MAFGVVADSESAGSSNVVVPPPMPVSMGQPRQACFGPIFFFVVFLLFFHSRPLIGVGIATSAVASTLLLHF